MKKELTIKVIKNNLEKISKDFDLEYDPNWFDFIWISKRHARYLEYVGMCFDPIYTRFGKIVEKRIENIEKFERSKEFKKIKKEYSGQEITKKEVLKGLRDCKKIKNKKIRKELLNLHRKINSHLKKGNLTLLTRTKNKQHKEILLKSILKHEWIHLLLFKNKIDFKSLHQKYWKYDEGLVTYLEYAPNRTFFLENIKNKIKYPSSRKYYTYAIKFRKLFNDCKNSKERKQKVREIYKSLKLNNHL